MLECAVRSWLAVGGTVVAAAGVIAAHPLPAPGVGAVRIALAAADVTLDLVRHGQSVDNLDGILGTVPPGAPLTATGVQQAHDVASVIHGEFPGGIGGIYASEFLRTQETAAPLAQLLGLDVQVLPGLNEIDAGALDGKPLTSMTELSYLAGPLAWIAGFYLTPQGNSTTDPNGVAFNDQVTAAIQDIYRESTAESGGTATNPVTDVVFSHAGTIATWTLMNVKNPDFSVVFDDLINTRLPLSNTGQVVLEGNPTDGWTLVSWDGHAVAATPDLLTALFVDVRDLIVAPQIAAWHIEQALGTGDSATAAEALQAGSEQVLNAITAFPQNVMDSFDGAAAGEPNLTVGDALASL